MQSAVGFAHTGHYHRVMDDGDILHGDTSMSIAYISRNWKDWEVVGTDAFLQDPFQTVIFATKKRITHSMARAQSLRLGFSAAADAMHF